MKWESRRQAMRALYEAGSTFDEIALEYGITRERVRQCVRKAGCEMFGHRSQFNVPLLAQSLREAESFTDACRRSGVHHAAVTKFAAELGMTESLRRLYRLRARRELLRKLQAVADRIGRPFRGGDFTGQKVLRGMPAAGSLRRCFGSTRAAVALLGLPNDWPPKGSGRPKGKGRRRPKRVIPARDPNAPARLTPHDVTILQHLAAGAGYKHLAAVLGLHQRNVYYHIARIAKQLPGNGNPKEKVLLHCDRLLTAHTDIASR
jgi:DNA-binding CsgD family transcriptional regulator